MILVYLRQFSPVFSLLCSGILTLINLRIAGGGQKGLASGCSAELRPSPSLLSPRSLAHRARLIMITNGSTRSRETKSLGLGCGLGILVFNRCAWAIPGNWTWEISQESNVWFEILDPEYSDPGQLVDLGLMAACCPGNGGRKERRKRRQIWLPPLRRTGKWEGRCW